MISSNNQIQRMIAIFAFIIGVVLGYMSFKHLGPIADNCQIKYVAQEEIIQLEKARVAKEINNPQEKDLFFGNIAKAVELTIELSRKRENKDTRVIFSVAPVFTEGVESLSHEVHEEVIAKLKQGQNQQENKAG
jgi:hypothetical protein